MLLEEFKNVNKLGMILLEILLNMDSLKIHYYFQGELALLMAVKLNIYFVVVNKLDC